MPPSSGSTPVRANRTGRKKTVRKPASGKKKQVQRKLNLPWWAAAGGLAFMALAILIPHWIEGGDHQTGASVPAGYRHFAMDISHHNKDIVWDSLRVMIDQDGRTSKNLLHAHAVLPLSRVYIKATEGVSMKDDRFPEYWAEAGRVGILRGAYHFFRTSTDPLEQAQNYIETVTLTHRDLPPVLDMETLHNGCTREELNRNALAWLRAVEAHYGRKPVVYTSDKFAQDNLMADILDYYPLWIARYNHEPPVTGEWTLWQFSDKAVVYGVKGYVDLSVIP